MVKKVTKPKTSMLEKLLPKGNKQPSSPAPTEPKTNTPTASKRGRPPSDDPTINFSVNAKTSLKDRLEQTTKAHGLDSVNGLIKFLLIDGLNRLDKGQLKLPIKQQSVLDLDE